MKKTILMGALCCLVSQPIIHALEIPEPYILVQSIPNEQIPAQSCIVLLTNNLSHLDEPSMDEQAIETKIQQIIAQIEQINNEIYYLEYSAPESLDWAYIQLEGIIDEVYQLYEQEYESFNTMSSEEQYELIFTDETVSMWQTYIDELNQQINQYVAERTQLEQVYQEQMYLLENYATQRRNQQFDRQEYNQCLLYPYSVEHLPMDTILLNPHLSLNDYLLQLDEYLKMIIPKAYRSVSYRDIFNSFNKILTEEELNQKIVGKVNIKIDDIAFEQYTYAKELSLNDIQTVSEFAQKDLLLTQDYHQYIQSYVQMIQIKDAQWQYFYQINQDTINYIRESLANYLNMQELSSEDEIEQVRALHERYQIKLALYDELSNTWHAVEPSVNGYTHEYLTLGESIESEPEITIEQTEESVTSIVNHPPNTSRPDSPHLQQIKDRIRSNRTQSSVKELPQPPSRKDVKNINRSVNDVTDQEITTSSSKPGLKLPTTGEKRPLTLVALIVLSIGIYLIYQNIKERRKRQRKIEKINLN